MDEIFSIQRKAKLFPNHEKKLLAMQSKKKNDKLNTAFATYSTDWKWTSLMYKELK